MFFLKALPVQLNHIFSVLSLLILACWYFFPHLIGSAIFIGDSDRMSHFLTWLIHMNEGIRNGYLPTWNNSLFGGYSSAGLPYIYYNPMALIGLFFAPELQNWVAGWTSMVWLFASGIAGYALIFSVIKNKLFAFLGAVLYQSCAVMALKISQNDGTFSVTVMTPIILSCIISNWKGKILFRILISFIAFTYLFSVSFLQEAAYACLLLTFFAIYRLQLDKDWKPLAILVASGLPALLISLPRLINAGIELSLSTRNSTTGFYDTWSSLGAFNSWELLRLLDDRIFGLYYSNALDLGNRINLHEGMLAYASTYAIVITLFGLFLFWKSRKNSPSDFKDIVFHSIFLIFSLSVVVTKFGYLVMYYLFLKIGFIHARVTTVAMISFCLLYSIFLYSMYKQASQNTDLQASLRELMILFVGCLFITIASEMICQLFVATTFPIKPGSEVKAYISKGAALRIFISIFLSIILIWFGLFKKGLRNGRQMAILAIGVLAAMQVATYAKDQISGGFMRSVLPFETPTRLLADPVEFLVPTNSARQRIRENLEADDYRVTLICDPQKISIFCSPYIANAWGLREIGGYVSAIPTRISYLPWGKGQVGTRSVNLESISQANWELLSLLNVKYAVEYNPSLITNSVSTPSNQTKRELSPEDLVVHTNPFPVVPRVFFVNQIDTASSIDVAAAKLFPESSYNSQRSDVIKQTVLEAPPEFAGYYGSDGDITAVFRDQFIDIKVTPSKESRFLIINERYHPNWQAKVGGNIANIYPANLLMRGVLIPPNVTTIELRFIPFSVSLKAYIMYIVGFLLLAIFLKLSRHLDIEYILLKRI